MTIHEPIEHDVVIETERERLIREAREEMERAHTLLAIGDNAELALVRALGAIDRLADAMERRG
jgi:hypothetical protein